MNKTIGILLCLLVQMACMAQTRDTVDLNRGWQFRMDGQKQWQTVNLPHDFQIGQPWVAPAKNERADNNDVAANIASRLSARGFKEMGIGWYKKTFIPDDNWKNGRVLLDFGGIMLTGEVWLNDSLVGGTDYGYVGFDIDITRLLHYGKENTVVVKADTRGSDNSRWYTGGGLYRDVRIITTPRDRYFGRHPLYITTKDNKFVNVKAEIYYADRKAKQLNIGIRIMDQQGRVVAESRQTPRYYRQQRLREYDLDSISLPNAHLWDTETPYLYTAEVSLYDEQGHTIDRVSSRFGMRTVQFSPEYGMKLNGKKTLLKGYAVHHTLGMLGAAAYPRAIEKQLRLMKEFGFNHIRTSHNPYSTDLYRLCDELGILVVDELYDKWTQQYAGGKRPWRELWQYDVAEWVKRDRNHPCVVLWSLGNELQQISTLDYNDWGVTAYRLQRELLRRYDSSRLCTVAMHPRFRDLDTDSVPAPLARATDVQSYNYRYMYFPGDRRRFPWMNFYQSEANETGLPGNFFEMELDKVIGLAYWGAIDYLGESRGWPMKGYGDGVFDISLQPKPMAWLIRSMFRPEEPVVRLAIVDVAADNKEWNGIKFSIDQTSDSWKRTDGDHLKVYTYTNADEVELIVNGKSLGKQKNPSSPKSRNKITWRDVEYKAGYIEAVAYRNGKVVARHRCETTGDAVALKLEPDNNRWKADGMDLQHVRITAVDRKGRRVPTANHDVSLDVSGKASLIAVGNGDLSSGETANQQHIHLYQGTATAILRADTNSGETVLKATAANIKSAKIKLVMQ